MADKNRTPKQKGKNKISGSTKVSRGWGLAHKLMSRAQNFSLKLKMSNGETSKITRLPIGVTIHTIKDEEGNVILKREYKQTRRFKVGYRLKRTPWGEGPQVISVRNAEPRHIHA